MTTSTQIEEPLREALRLYLAEFGDDGYTVGTFFAFAARALLTTSLDAPIYLQREADAYGHCVALAAEQAWRVIAVAESLKRKPAAKGKRSCRISLKGK